MLYRISSLVGVSELSDFGRATGGYILNQLMVNLLPEASTEVVLNVKIPAPRFLNNAIAKRLPGLIGL